MKKTNIYKLTNIDPWFLEQISDIIKVEKKLKKNGIPKTFKEFSFIKSIGFYDSKIAELTKSSVNSIEKKRRKLNQKKIIP